MESLLKKNKEKTDINSISLNIASKSVNNTASNVSNNDDDDLYDNNVTPMEDVHSHNPNIHTPKNRVFCFVSNENGSLEVRMFVIFI